LPLPCHLLPLAWEGGMESWHSYVPPYLSTYWRREEWRDTHLSLSVPAGGGGGHYLLPLFEALSALSAWASTWKVCLTLPERRCTLTTTFLLSHHSCTYFPVTFFLPVLWKEEAGGVFLFPLSAVSSLLPPCSSHSFAHLCQEERPMLCLSPASLCSASASLFSASSFSASSLHCTW